jgi:phosphoglycolate phosphatase
MSVETVLFDLDGTLTDPGEGITRCIRFALEEHGLPDLDDAVLAKWIGPPLRDSFASIGARSDQVEALVEAYRRRFREVGIFENVVYPGVRRLLEKLGQRGITLHVVTSKPEPFAEKILEHFELRGAFDRVFGSNLDGTRSEKRELLVHARNEAGFEIATTLMVGDRRFDVEAARAEGMRALGALWGYGGRDELEVAGASAIVDSARAVLQWVDAATLSAQAGS